MTQRRQVLIGFGLAAAAAAFKGTTMAHAETATATPDWTFESIYGGSYGSADFAGKVVLLVNTASLCGYTPQYSALQKLQDTYKDRGLVVFAVPSDDFHQETASNGEVKSFCELNYGITLPMSVIAHVTGPQAHPLYLWLKQTTGFEPKWNFNKVLFDRQGKVVGTWRSGVEPIGSEIETEVQRLLS
jgi:glutathione peroxidase